MVSVLEINKFFFSRIFVILSWFVTDILGQYIGPIVTPEDRTIMPSERLVTNQPVLCDNPEEWRSKLHSSKSLKFFHFFLQVVKNTLNPVWQKFAVPVRTLCNGDYHRNTKVTCYDWNSNGKHSLIGEFFITLHQLSEGHSVYQCVHPEKLVCI